MNRTNKRKGYRALSWILLLVCLVCVVLLLVPVLAQSNSDKEVIRQITDYNEVVEKVTNEVADKMIETASAFNQRLLGTGTMFSTVKEDEYNSVLRVNNDIMGYINIPSVNIHLCIYHGTAEETIEMGIGHVNTTSLPVGDTTAHTILIGHRGVPTNRLFTDLDKVQIGDEFTINVLNRTFKYEVESIETIKPYELENMRFEEGRNLVSLVTCTPYGVNTHRLVVTGVLKDTTVKLNDRTKTETSMHEETDVIHRSIPFEPALIVVGIFIVLFIGYFVYDTIKKRKKRGS